MSDTSHRSWSKKTQWMIIGGVALLMIIALSSRLLAKQPSELTSPPKKEVSTGFRPTTEQWADLKVAPVQTMSFRSEQATDGNIAYNEDHITPVFSPFSGRVVKLIAKPGDFVRKGDRLMAVEATEIVQGQSDLVAAAGTLSTAQEQVKLAALTEQRQHQLYLIKAAALKDWLQSQSDLATAQNNVHAAESALSAVQNRLRILGKSGREITELQSIARLSHANPVAYVVAPIAGTVTQRQVSTGQYITNVSGGAANPVYSIGNLSTVWLIANVREEDAPLMRTGLPVEVRVMAYPGRVFKARIDWVAPAIDATTRRLPVRAEVENRDGALKPMMFADFNIITSSTATAPAVPQDAIVYEGDAAHVFVANTNGTLSARSIRTGRTTEGMVEVTAGLTAGERVVTSGTLFIDRAAQGS